jgi:cbb3-type cytochrome oxidase subunit 3
LPSTWTMLIAGFVGLGFFAYRGSKKNGAALSAA